MKVSIVSTNAVDARAEAKKKLGGTLYISTVLHVKNRPDVRLWTFSTELLG